MNTPFTWRRLALLMLAITASATGLLAQTFPTSFTCSAEPFYLHKKDGQPGRGILLEFKDAKLYGKIDVKVDCNGIIEDTHLDSDKGIANLMLTLPAGAGVDKECQARVSVYAGGKELHQSIMVPAKREWTVYIYPHSHVDIGYTNTQEFVLKLHEHNIDVGIELAKKTQNYPEGARFVWNPEATWVTESYLKQASPEKKQQFIEAVKKGWISLDGDYDNSDLTAYSDEELLRLFHTKHQLQQLTGVNINTMVQMDVPGAGWGVVQAAAQNGIKAFFSYPNLGAIRKPWEHHPFYWIGPDGKSKMLFFEAFPYGYGYELKGSKIGLGRVQGHDTSIDRIKTDNPMEHFIDPLIFDETEKLERGGSPYSIFVMPWSMADNSLIDADLPDAVKMWNEKYAFPKLIIAGSQRILNDIETRYSKIIPEIKGDYSEYWTDGLGSDARRVGMHHIATENLVQAETAWTMLHPNQPADRHLIDSAWQNCLLGTEHTWGYQDPKAPLAKSIEQTKASYFENSLKNSEQLLNETFKSISAQGNKVAVLNTLSWNRSGLIKLSKAQSAAGDRVLNDKGKAVLSQRLSTGELVFWADEIPVLGSRTFTIAPGQPSRSKGCTVVGNTLTNDLFNVSIDPKTGDVSRLTDHQTKQEYVDTQSPYGINSYRYLLGQDNADQATAPTGVKLRIKENGPLVVSIVASSKADGCNWLNREVTVVYNQPWVDLTNTFDKISTRTKEGIHFGFAFNVPGATTRMDIPWGSMIPEFDQITGANKNWYTFERWVDQSNDHAGIAWTCVEAPLIEFGGMTANLLGGAYGSINWYKTLTKTQPLFSWALNNHWGTNFPLEQGGVITLHYAVYPHKAYDAVAVNRFGFEVNRPLLVTEVKQKPTVHTWVNVGNPKVIISMLKQSDDGKGMILRIRSVSDQAEKPQLSWPDGKPRILKQCLADEHPGADATADEPLLPNGVQSYYFEM